MTELNPPPELHHSTTAAPLQSDTATAAAPTKRQRRPSVRLGDIGGDQYHHLYESNPHLNRKPKQQQQPPQCNPKSSSKTQFLETGKINNNSAPIGTWNLTNSSSKSKRGPTPAKRVRSNWRASSEEDKFSDDEEIGFRDFDGDDISDNGLKEQSPIHANRRDVRVRVSDGVELDGPSDTDARTWNNNLERNGVRAWLNDLGLGRYAPVFEIHEVDDEVLPQLTLEDLKDMGINAVGSRRKMYSSIQKLGKGFS